MASRLFLGAPMYASEKRRVISREESIENYKAHIQREIANDPSMAYYYSSKYKEEHQNMYSGGASFSNINPQDANNFSSPVGSSFTSPFDSLSNEIAPLKIPPFLTIDDILKNPKIREFTQNIAGNETNKQIYVYNQNLRESFQEESPLSPEDRSTVEDMADLVSFLNRVGVETEKAEKAEQERRAKNPPVMAKNA